MDKTTCLALKPSRPFPASFLKSYLLAVLLTCAAAYYIHHRIQEHCSIRNKTRETIGIELKRDAVDNALRETNRDIRLITGHHRLKRLLEHPLPDALRDFKLELLNLSAATGIYDQIRWIDESGRERLRIHFNNGQPSPAPETELLDESDLYRLMESNKLTAGAVYVSPLELNGKQTRFEFPRNSVLRIASPVFDSLGKRRGLIVLNYSGRELSARFEKAGTEIAGRAILLDAQGFWLNSPLPAQDRDVIFTPATPDFSLLHPAIRERISHTEHGQFEDEQGVWTFSTVYPNSGADAAQNNAATANTWKIVSFLPHNMLYGNRAFLMPVLAWLTALLLVEAMVCWKLAGNRQAAELLQSRLRQSNRTLQKLVTERTAQLQAAGAMREQAEKQLQLFSAAFKAAANAIIIIDSHSIIQWANPAFAALTGFPLEDAIGKSPQELIRRGLQSKAFYRALSISILSQRGWRGEIVNQHKDGFLYTESLTITPISNGNSGITHFIAVKENISDRKQAETRLANLTLVHTMLSNINHAIVHLRDPAMLLKEICRIAVEDGGFEMAWIGLGGGEKLIPAAFAGIDRETLEQLNSQPKPGDQRSYPADAAYFQACSVGSNDIEHDPRTLAWRHKALALGYASVLALPIKSGGKVRGVCSLYAGKANTFSNRQIKLLNDMADNIAFAMERAETMA